MNQPFNSTGTIRGAGAVVAVIAMLAAGCSMVHRPAGVSTSADLDRLVTWMSGSFSSEKQAAADSEYRDIRLHMVPIWKERADGHWLYVEQAVASSADKPYRQRVYHVTQRPDGGFESAVFKLPGDPLKYAGAWKSAGPLSDLSPDKLEPRTGCSIVLTKKGGPAFEGGTTGKQCPSDLRGAAYATSQVTIEATRMVSWDRGFNEVGEQVWGATGGGYLFLKFSE